MKIQLSDHFSYSRLLRFTLPSIVMMIFTSIYGVVDGFFVSNYVGKTPFTAVNFIMPLLMILGCIGFMFGTGGAALVAMKMGEGENGEANRIFSMNVWVSAGMAVVIAAFGILFLRPLARLMGAEGRMLDDCVVYGRIVLAALPFYVLQYEFQCLFATAEKPKLGLFVTVAAGVTNMVLDAVFVAVFSWGLVGAAAATAFSQLVGGVLPLIYFGRKNSSRLRLGRLHFDGRALRKTLTNGSSEFMSNVSMSLVGMLYNLQLMAYAGENGIAAYGVLMYVNMIFLAIFIGYSVGVAPVVGFHFGAKNHRELHGLLRKSLLLIAATAVLMFVLLSVLRLFDLRLVLFHGAQRRPDLGAGLLAADDGVSGRGRPAAAAALGDRRRLAVDHRRRGALRRRNGRLPARQAQKIRILNGIIIKIQQHAPGRRKAYRGRV